MNEFDDRRGDPFFTPGVIAATVVAIILAAALFVWAPWSTRTADNAAAPGVTTGQSTPGAAPPAAQAPAPAPQK